MVTMTSPAPAPSSTSAPIPPANDSGWRGAGIVLGTIFGVSTLLATYMFWQYSKTLAYVRNTIGDPDRGLEPVIPQAWHARPLSPEECVDATLHWTRECVGIKTMCDMYVERVIGLCMDTQDRNEFCHAIVDDSFTTEFGVPECRARGVRRNVNKEACANSYRTIDAYCEIVREIAASEGSQ
jgi:hypothetical protein